MRSETASIARTEIDEVFDDGVEEGEDVTVEAFDDNAFYYWENGELKKMDSTEDAAEVRSGLMKRPVLEIDCGIIAVCEKDWRRRMSGTHAK